MSLRDRMNILVYTKNVDLTPSEQRRLRLLNQRLPRYFRGASSVSWRFSGAPRECTASCSVQSPSGAFRARAIASKAGAAMDEVFEKVVRQRRRERAQATTRRSRSGAQGKRRLARVK